MPHLSVDDIAVSPCESYACAFVGVERYQLPCTVTQPLRVISYGRSEHVQLIIHTLFSYVLVLLS